MIRCFAVLAAIFGLWHALLTAAIARDELPEFLRKLDANVLTPEQREQLRPGDMLERNIAARLRQANQKSTAEWRALKNRTDWERFRDERIEKLRQSLGTYPEPPVDLKLRVTRSDAGDGYRVENIRFESRPGLYVTANLYLPAKYGKSMPGIILCHSHHAPKSEGELQDLGQMWARRGCVVLVPDQLGHGERRQHPFRTADDYPASFRVGRQDYHFRYILGMQLHALGDSLAGWLVWDLRRGVDLLVSQPGIDRDRIILLGAVAGGGDPAAVAAALDSRIAAVVPFNFGGPQPETRSPLPEDVEERFNYAGGGSWESTRNLTASARDGFLPWVIVGSVAPRGLIYAHEFQWDQPRDPVWKRLETIFGWYDARDKLASVAGSGSVRGNTANDTHCNNIGPVHRRSIDPTFTRWFQIEAPIEAPRERRSSDQLACWTPELKAELKPQLMHQIAKQIGQQRIRTMLESLQNQNRDEQRTHLRETWSRILGGISPAKEPRVLMEPAASLKLGATVTVHRVALEVEPGLIVPLLFLLPETKDKTRLPVVVAFAQAGKQRLLNERADDYSKLLSSGIAICLPDLRGIGETAPQEDSRGWRSTSTGLSSTELMLGSPMLGARLRDLRTVLSWLRRHERIDADRIAVWGDSCTPPNPPEQNVGIPLELEQPPAAEPLGGLLALLAGLYESDLRAISAHGGLISYMSLLDHQFCRVPHDIIVPGAIAAGDLSLLAVMRAPQPLQITATVNALNQLVRVRVPEDNPPGEFDFIVGAYAAANASAELQLYPAEANDPVKWLQRYLQDQ